MLSLCHFWEYRRRSAKLHIFPTSLVFLSSITEYYEWGRLLYASSHSHRPIQSCCADVHFLLYCVITVQQYYRQMDRCHVHCISTACKNAWHVICILCYSFVLLGYPHHTGYSQYCLICNILHFCCIIPFECFVCCITVMYYERQSFISQKHLVTELPFFIVDSTLFCVIVDS